MRTANHLPILRAWQRAALCAVAFSIGNNTGFGQAAATNSAAASPQANQNGPTIVLSPFQVDTTRDIGYIANRDVTASRFNTAVRDTPVAVTIFTPEMLRDLNVVNAQEAMDYAPNVEFTEQTAGIADISTFKMRVRGFANAGAGGTQDFFSVLDDLDTYKIERLGFARGPNGVLFGVGQPGGQITATPKNALFRNQYEVDARFDTWGGWRTTLDTNHVLIPKRAALRLAAKKEDERDGVEDQYRKDERVFIAGNFALIDRPIFKTTLRGNYEWIQGRDAVGNVQLLTEQLSNWVAAGRPIGNTVATTPGTAALAATPRLTYIGGGSPDLPIMSWSGKLLATGPATLNGPAVLTEDIFPYDRNPRGDVNVAPRKITASTVFLEQQVGEDLFIELAGFRTKGFRRAITPLNYQLRADPNATLPNGVPNPNAGKLYIEHNGQHSDRYSWRNTYRGSASYTFHFDKINSRLGHWLGRHQLFGAYEESYESSAFERLVVVNDTPLPGVTQRRDNAANLIWARSYVDPVADAYGFGVDLNNLQARDGVTPRLLPTAGQDRNRSKNFASIFALQSHFWKDRIVGTLGWRKDELRNYNGRGEALRDPATGILPYARNQQSFLASETTFRPTSKGVVVRPLEWLGLQYNEAENFAAASPSQVTIFGEPIPARGGIGKDYGLRFDLLKDKLTATIIYYETTAVNAIISQTIADDVNRIWTTLGRPERTAGDPNVRDVQNEESKGWEFSSFYNPTPRWRIALSFTKNNTVVSNVHPNWLRYAATHLATWRGANQNQALVGGTGTLGEAIDRIVAYEATALSNEGNTAFNLRKWNGSLVTNYRFNEGRFKGGSVGGAVLYRGDAVVGYPIAGGIPQFNQPFTEKGYYIVNLNFGYEHRLNRDRTLFTRLTLQNALDWDGQLVVTQRSATSVPGAPVGTALRGRWIEGANASLTVGLKF